MQEDREKLRQSIIVTILAAYLVPILAFTFLSVGSMSFADRWLFFSISLLMGVFGSIILILSMLNWESLRSFAPVEAIAAPPSEPQNDEQQIKLMLEESKRREKDLMSKVGLVKQKWHVKKSECERLEEQFQKVQNEYESLLHHSQEQLKKKDRLLAEYAQTVNELRATMEKKQDQIEKLQDSVNDLSYDLDTLLKLSDFKSLEEVQEQGESEPVQQVRDVAIAPNNFGRDEASALLKKCINVAQKMTTSQFSTNSRFRELPIDSTALDQRRLFESFRSETSCIIVMHSMKEGSLYFANDMTKQLLGWSPDKFVQEFPHLIQKGGGEWKNALQSLGHQSEAWCHLEIRDRSDEIVELEGCLGVIPTGAFKNYAIGILFEK